MKKNLQYIDLDAELIDYDTYEIGNNIMKSTQNLHSIIKKIDKIECYKTEHCCILGTELANFKYLHIIKKCINCVNETDIFKVLDCTTCNSVKNKMKDCYKK